MDGVSRTAGRALCLALAAAGLLWGALFAWHPQGIEARVFFERGRTFFADFRAVRTCAEGGFATDRQPLHDSCYPPLGALLAKPFPLTAGAWFTGTGMALWALAFWTLLARRDENGEDAPWRFPAVAGLAVVGCLLSSIMLHAFEWGNQILYAAAAVTLFVAWWDAPSPCRLAVAAVALAVAAVLKVSPTLLAGLYLVRWWTAQEAEVRRESLRAGALFLAAAAVMFVVPFAWYDGWTGFCQWFANALANAAHYVHKGAWGFVPLDRTVRVLLHLDVSTPWPGIGLARGLSAALGLACLGKAALCAYRRTCRADDLLLLLVAAMLLIPGNMHVYTGLYLLPVLALRLHAGMRWTEAACWFALLCPLQIPLGAGCLNHPLANLAFLALVAAALCRSGGAARPARPALPESP